MRLAAARAGLGFFGSMIFIYFIFGSYFEEKTISESIVILVFFGAVIGGAIFCSGWYEYEREEREHKLAERRKALESSEKSDKTT